MKYLVLCLIAVTAMALADPGRALKPAFKGVEMYSYRDSGGWCYVLLPGTNRNKSAAEVYKAPPLRGTEKLKAEMARLAVGEQVFWFHRDANGFEYPDADTIQEIVRYGRQVGVEVNVP